MRVKRRKQGRASLPARARRWPDGVRRTLQRPEVQAVELGSRFPAWCMMSSYVMPKAACLLSQRVLPDSAQGVSCVCHVAGPCKRQQHPGRCECWMQFCANLRRCLMTLRRVEGQRMHPSRIRSSGWPFLPARRPHGPCASIQARTHEPPAP